MVRNKGDYEQWISFFLDGVIETGKSALIQTKKIIDLHETYKKLLWRKKVSSPVAMQFLDRLFHAPVVSINDVQNALDISFQAASNLITQFETLGIVKELTGKKREKRFGYTKYLTILSIGTDPLK